MVRILEHWPSLSSYYSSHEKVVEKLLAKFPFDEPLLSRTQFLDASASGHGVSLPYETSDNTNVTDESALNAKKIKILLDKEKERTLLLETQLAAFKEMCHETEKRSKKIETAFPETVSRADNLQSQVVKLQSSLSDRNQQLLSADSTKHELKDVKPGAMGN